MTYSVNNPGEFMPRAENGWPVNDTSPGRKEAGIRPLVRTTTSLIAINSGSSGDGSRLMIPGHQREPYAHARARHLVEWLAAETGQAVEELRGREPALSEPWREAPVIYRPGDGSAFDHDRPHSRRLTPGDRQSPIPNDVIDEGKAFLEASGRSTSTRARDSVGVRPPGKRASRPASRSMRHDPAEVERILTEARDAIARGSSREAVIERLRQMGVDPGEF